MLPGWTDVIKGRLGERPQNGESAAIEEGFVQRRHKPGAPSLLSWRREPLRLAERCVSRLGGVVNVMVVVMMMVMTGGECRGGEHHQ